MCTLTAFPLNEDGIRLAFNRDVSRRRPAALPPSASMSAQRRIVRPVDTQGGGTWIGINDLGLTAALMNVSTSGGVSPTCLGPASRGEIVPQLLASRSLAEAGERALRLDAARYLPFRVFLYGEGSWMDVISDAAGLRALGPSPLGEPVMRTTSRLGDDLVERPRRELFESLLGRGDPRCVQDAFHGHSWSGRPHLSVCMRRADAATVSLSILEIDRGRRRATLLYHPAPPDEPTLREVALLELS